jgi:hypothetical protein
MKAITLLFSSIIILNAYSQITVPLTPTKDASVGFHDGYDSDDTNYGYATHFSAFSQPAASGIGENAGWGIMDFDFSSIPAGTTIISANLKLYAFGTGFSIPLPTGHDGANSSYLSRIVSPWDEFTVTWNTRPDFITDNQVTLPESISSDENYTDINVTALVQDIINDPSGSFGLCLRLVDESPTAGLLFASTDFGDDSKLQKLSVTYSGPNTVLQNSNNAVFNILVYPNPTNGNVCIKYNASVKSAFSVHFINNLGEELMSSDYTNICGENQIMIDLKELKITGGVYII